MTFCNLFYHNSDLLSGGTSFQINHDNMAETIDQDIFDEVGSDDDGENDDPNEDLDNKLSPWKKSFGELKMLMVEVPNPYGKVYKRIITEGVDEVVTSHNCEIRWTFSMFFETESIAFDSSYKPIAVKKEDITLIGLRIAVASMRKKEEAQFIIDYKLMFGEMGCPPRIKASADILLVAKLVDFVEIGDENACNGLSEQDRRKFNFLKDKVNEMYKKSLDHFRNQRYKYAISVGQAAIRALELCQVANEAEQIEQQKLLNEMYIQLSSCYIKTENWRKCCLMVNELRRRADISRNITVILNEAIALSHIEDDFRRPIELLRGAQKIDPHNELVNRELNDMLAKDEKYKNDHKKMWQKAFDVKQRAESYST